MVGSASEDLILWQRHLSVAGPQSWMNGIPYIFSGRGIDSSEGEFCSVDLFYDPISERIFRTNIHQHHPHGQSCPHNRKQFGPLTLNPQRNPKRHTIEPVVSVKMQANAESSSSFLQPGILFSISTFPSTTKASKSARLTLDYLA